MLGSSILKLIYDIDIENEDDSRLVTVEKAVHVIAVVGNAGSYLGNIPMISIYVKLTVWFTSSRYTTNP